MVYPGMATHRICRKRHQHSSHDNSITSFNAKTFLWNRDYKNSALLTNCSSQYYSGFMVDIACVNCSYPIGVSQSQPIGTVIRCPYCGTTGTIEEAPMLNRRATTPIEQGEIAIPTWLFAGGIGFILGGILIPSIMAATDEGSRKLAEMSRKYIGKK